jgi:hypothetical protein
VVVPEFRVNVNVADAVCAGSVISLVVVAPGRVYVEVVERVRSGSENVCAVVSPLVGSVYVSSFVSVTVSVMVSVTAGNVRVRTSDTDGSVWVDADVCVIVGRLWDIEAVAWGRVIVFVAVSS